METERNAAKKYLKSAGGIVSGSLGDGIIDELLRYYKNFSGKKTEKIKFLKKAKKIIYLNQDYESMWIWLMIAKKELNSINRN